MSQEKEQYIKSRQTPGEETHHLDAETMSEFYKMFLDKNWETHVKYNIEWYKKNFTLLYLAFRVSLERSLGKIL